jgi:proteasome regulatory subunit
MENMSPNVLKKIEDLKTEIKILKEDNTKTKRNLMWKVRKLEKDKVLIENEKMRLDREVKSLRGEIERFRSPPLVIATVTEVLDDGRVVVKSSTGPNFVIGY